MDFLIDFVLFGLLVIGITAFLGSIVRLLVKPFVRRTANISAAMTSQLKTRWKKVGGRSSS